MRDNKLLPVIIALLCIILVAIIIFGITLFSKDKNGKGNNGGGILGNEGEVVVPVIDLNLNTEEEEQVYSMVDDDEELAAVAGVFENMLEDIDLI